MTRLGRPVPQEIEQIRRELERNLQAVQYSSIDADSYVTGRDFLLKIWKIIISVPIGIAIINQDLNRKTMANIFYEIGLMQALGKDTLVIRTENTEVPSDFVRTEYIIFNNNEFDDQVQKYFHTIEKLGEHYRTVASHTVTNPLLSIDYLKRAYLISGENDIKVEAERIYNDPNVSKCITGYNVHNLIDFSWLH